MKSIVCALAMAAGLYLSGGVAGAADPPPPVVVPAPPVIASPPSPDAVALAKRYFAAANLDGQMRALVKSLTPVLIQEELKRVPNITATQKTALAEVVEEATVAWFPEYEDSMAVIYAQTFTRAELEGLVAFYESPVGHSVVSKSAALAPAATAVMQSALPRLEALMHDRLCRKLSCDRLKPSDRSDAS